MEEALFAEKERAQVTLNCIGDAVVCTDVAGSITFLNRGRRKHDRLVAGRRPRAGRSARSFQILDAATRGAPADSDGARSLRTGRLSPAVELHPDPA